MQIDLQTFVNVLVGIGLPVAGWFLRRLSLTQQELTDFRLEVAKEYVTFAHLVEIKEALLRIEAKIDSKQDK
jgi:hypothetical protein